VEATFLIFGLTLLFYILIAIDVSPELTWKPSFYLSDIFYTISSVYEKLFIFPQLFNPARAINRMFDENKMDVDLSASLYFLDAIHRIILTFFIVQIVSAFRKFIK